MTGPRIGSVCGYGGLDMAVQQVLGGTLAWVADPDPGPRAILAHHHPTVPNLGDITALDWHQVPPVDVLIGGYPCQPFSVAGHRKGTADARHLWPYIADAIGALRPSLCLFENVAGHLRLGFPVVLRDLARLGLDAEWVVVPASGVGAAHQRKRLFIAAWPADSGGPGLAWWRAGGAVADRRHDTADTDCHAVRQQPVAEPGCSSATVVGLLGPGPAANSGHWGEPERPRSARREEGERPSVGGVARRADTRPGPDADRAGCGCNRAPWGKYTAAVHRWETVLGRPAPTPVTDLGRLAPVFVEWLMGIPAGHVTAVPGLSRTAQLKALGNGVVPLQAVTALRHLLDRAETTRTL